MPIEHLTPAIEDRAVDVQALLADRGQHRAPAVPERLIAAMSQRAVAIVEGAPELEHPTAVMGVRNLAQAFDRNREQLHGLAFLLSEIEAVNAEKQHGWPGTSGLTRRWNRSRPSAPTEIRGGLARRVSVFAARDGGTRGRTRLQS